MPIFLPSLPLKSVRALHRERASTDVFKGRLSHSKKHILAFARIAQGLWLDLFSLEARSRLRPRPCCHPRSHRYVKSGYRLCFYWHVPSALIPEISTLAFVASPCSSSSCHSSSSPSTSSMLQSLIWSLPPHRYQHPHADFFPHAYLYVRTTFRAHNLPRAQPSARTALCAHSPLRAQPSARISLCAHSWEHTSVQTRIPAHSHFRSHMSFHRTTNNAFILRILSYSRQARACTAYRQALYRSSKIIDVHSRGRQT